MFRVQWLRQADDELARIWTEADASLRQAITVAADALDEQLRADPFRQSESRGGEERVLFVYPLAVQVEVDVQQSVVWVLHVWRFRRRGK
jgi:hypothetical protein